MHIINITVRNKVATAPDERYVCGNADYIASFDLDAEWAEHDVKTARFIKPDGTYNDQVFYGTECPVPKMTNITYFVVGLFAGDLQVTTPAMVSAKKSILCASGTPDVPSDDVYAQTMALLENYTYGFYIPSLTPIDKHTVKVSYTKSRDNIPDLDDVIINIPEGPIGEKGDAGVTPHIGENGNWFVGQTDTGIPAQGERGKKGDQGDGVPEVTEADNDKFLRVKNGAWVAVSVPAAEEEIF